MGNHLVVVVIELIVGTQENAEGSEIGAWDGRLAEWAFAALLFVEEPLMDEIQYQLQRLRRACQKVLASAGVPQRDHAVDAELSASQGARAGAALLLTIVQDVFGQR